MQTARALPEPRGRLKLVPPRLREGAMVLTDNVGLFRADYADYLSWVRDPANGFSYGVLALREDAELSVRVAPS